MKLLEVFDSPYPYRWADEQNSDTHKDAKFISLVNNTLYTVFFEDSGNGAYWDSGFFYMNQSGHREFVLDNKSINPTRIYATVLAIYEEFLRNPPEDMHTLNVEANSDRTLDLYRIGLKRIADRLGGYEVLVRGGDTISIRRVDKD